MNRLFFIISFLLSPFVLLAQTFVSESNDSTAFIEYNDGEQWVYRNIDNLIVGMTNKEIKDDYGKYYQVKIFINNNRDSSLIFDPNNVLAELLLNNGNTSSQQVYTNEEFQKKIKRTQLIRKLSSVSTSGSEGYSTTYTTSYSPYGYMYTSVSRTYDENAAQKAKKNREKDTEILEKRMENDRVVRKQGYLKINTIHPGNTITGYMNIKHKKGKRLLITLDVGDRRFQYLWDVEKNKK